MSSSEATRSEARELAAVVLRRLAPRLPEVAAAADAPGPSEARVPSGPSTSPGGDDPSHRLYRLVADRLRALGEQEALAELIREPHNDSLVRRLLATAVADDAAYAAELAAAVAAMPAEKAAVAAMPAEKAAVAAMPAEKAAVAAMPAEKAAVAAAEPAGDDVAPPGAGQPSAPGGAVRPDRRRALWLSLGTATVVAVLAFLVGRAVVDDLRDAGGLTSHSTCAEYRRATPEERVAAVRRIGLAKGVSDAHNPLVMAALDQLCETQPTARLGDLVERFR